MKTGRLLLLVATALGWGVLPAGSAPLNPRERVLSASRQFVVQGADPLLAARLCATAENLKRAFHRLLDIQEQWRSPIFIVLENPAGDGAAAGAVALQTVLFEGQLRYQIHSRAPHDEPAIGLALVEALCLEQANRDLVWRAGQPLQGAVVPCWLSAGLAEILQDRPGGLLGVLQRATAGPRPLGLAPVLARATWPANPAEHQLFRAHAWLLVDSLLLLPQGASRLRQLLFELGPTVSPAEVFDRLYGTDLGQGVAREKWWALQLARKQVVQPAQTLAAAATARELTALLELSLAEPDTGPTNTIGFAQLVQYVEQDWFGAVWTDKARQLHLLRARAHPLYVPVIDAYLEALVALQQASPRRFRVAVKHAAAQQRAADKRAAQLRDYLEQAERVHAPVDPAILESYRAIVTGTTPPLTNSPLSEYLDRFDR